MIMIQMQKKLKLKKAKTNFKTGAHCFGFFLFILFSVSTCKQDQELTGRSIVEQSVTKHGGLSNWDSITALSFDKTTLLFDKYGKVESSTTQQQLFKFQPVLQGQIVSFYKGLEGLYYNGKEFRKRMNDSIYTVIDSTELASARNSFYAANYVVSQPFKLLDEGTVLSYIGIETLDNKQVYVVDVSYSGSTDTSDKWTYYFDVKNYQLVANKVIHNANVSLIKNLKFDSTSGFLFNAHRKSFTLKSSGEIDYLRAEYFYENFKVKQ